MAQTPQNPNALTAPTNTVEYAGPANAHDYLIIAGEKRTVPGARIITFVDDASWDFSKLIHPDPNSKYVQPRHNDKGLPIADLTTIQGIVDMVVIHSDITIDSQSCFRVLKQRGFSTHFMVNWDGTIYQGTDPANMAMHAASELSKNVNNHSIGIDVNCLQMNYVSSGDVDPGKAGLAAQMATGATRRMSDVVEINGVPWKSWGYTDAQYDALVKLLQELSTHFPKLKLAAPMDERGEVIWQVPEAIDTEKMGIYGHMHLTAQKFDPGPGFDWPRLIQGLTKEHNDLPVELVKGTSIATLLTEEKVQALAEHYFRNTEGSELGGFYPVGLGGQWHGGIHLHARRGSEVHAMMDGVVVAARNGVTPELGSNNFVLLRHEVPFDPQDDKRTFVFYSLYMHLQRFDADMDKNDAAYQDKLLDARLLEQMAPEWVSNARRSVTGKDEDADAAKAKESPPDAAPKTDPAKPKKKDAPKPKVQAPAQKAKKAGDDEDEDKPIEYKPFLDHGPHLAALKLGDVALFAIDGSDQTKVAAGKVIGRVGNFGESDGDEGVLHVEVFADGRWRQVVDLLGLHSKYWTEIEADTDDNLMVDTAELLRAIAPDPDSHVRKKRSDFILSSRSVVAEDVIDFYGHGDKTARAELHRSITRHVSEWSDQVDWFKSMATAQGWDERVEALTKLLQDERGAWRTTLFAQQIAAQLPFMWLTADVAKHIGLETGGQWDGILYYFHPVHFVLWLTFHTNTRLRVLAKGRDKKQLLELRAKEQKAEEERRKAGGFPEDDDHGGGDDTGGLDEVADPAEVLGSLWDVPSQPGEWQRASSEPEP